MSLARHMAQSSSTDEKPVYFPGLMFSLGRDRGIRNSFQYFFRSILQGILFGFSDGIDINIMRKHVFADESGCLTFSRKQNISKYFMLCTIVSDNAEIGHEVLRLRRDLSWRGEDVQEFHATSDKQTIRDEVFSCISELNFRIDVTILEKSKAQPKTRVDEPTFYQYAWYYHFKHVAPRIAATNDELHITAASLGTKKKQKAFNTAINDVTRQVLGSASYATSFWSSASDPCLQIADYCAWAIKRKWENNDLRSYELIQDKIATEFDLWSKGLTHYY